MLGALTMDAGLTVLMAVEGGTSGEVFLAYVQHVLLPEMNPGDIVLMDNLGAHREHRVLAAFHHAGVHVRFLPPYSPEFNPIELAWAKVRWFLRIAKARSYDALNNARPHPGHHRWRGGQQLLLQAPWLQSSRVIRAVKGC